MKKDDVITQYKTLVHELGESAHNVVLSAGAAAVMMGIRDETTNLDVDVLPGVFKWAAINKKIEKSGTLNDRVVYSENIGLHELDEDRGRVCIEGVWVYSPRELIIQKRQLGHDTYRCIGKRVRDEVEVALLISMGHVTKFTAKAV
jgi:hypothetical protein